MGGGCDRLCHLLRRPGDTAEDVRLRRLTLPVVAFVCIVSFSAILAAGIDQASIYLLGCVVACGSSICGMLHILSRVRGSYATFMSWVALAITVGVLLIDLSNVSGMGTRLWPTIVLVMDYLVVVNSKLGVQVVIVVITISHLTVIGVESVVLFGIYDVGQVGQPPPPLCVCPNPPCAVPVDSAVLSWIVTACVFVLDFFITRGFAISLRHQVHMNEATVRVAEQVAKLLADYAIDDARDVVAEDGRQLSEPLRGAFGKLLDNLERYRAFLPVGLLAEARGGVLPVAGADCAQVVPQLGLRQMRRAVEGVWSQAARHCRDRAEEVMAEVLLACIAAGDAAAAQRMLHLGWEPPAALAAQVSALAVPLPLDLSGLGMAEDNLSTSVSEHRQSRHRFSIQTGSIVSADPQVGRFGDGADDPAASLVAAPLWPPEYTPPQPVDAVRRMHAWHEPTGNCHWPGEAVDGIVSNHRALFGAVDPGKNMIALYVYTAELFKGIVWAVWQGGRWKGSSNLDKCASGDARVFRLDADLRRDLGLRRDAPGVAELLLESPYGVCVYSVDGEPRVLRYENRCGGDFEVSPLNDTVLWAVESGHIMSSGCMFSVAGAGGSPVPPGVLEFITARDFADSCSGRDWESAPLVLFNGLHEQCMAQKNQQRPKDHLCQLAAEAFSKPGTELGGFSVGAEKLSVVLPVVYRAKCPSRSPTPAQIAHACELGVLRWHHSHAVVALTGEPRIAVPLSGHVPSAVQIWRVDSPYSPAQPYLLMNNAMRSQQLGDRDARLSFSGHPLPFYASQPDDPPPEPGAAVFHNANGAAQWLGTRWAVTLAGCPAARIEQGEVAPQGWGLPQYRAVIWHIDSNLCELCFEQGPARRVKGYRGLRGVTLNRAVYSRGSVVMFPAFTSTSGDQGVAADFAKGEDAAAIFTTFTTSGCAISRCSRFGREKEVLLRPNTLLLVTEALSAEHAAIVDKEALQVFDLKEVTPAEATRHLAGEAAVALSGEHPSLLGQAARAASCAGRGEWVAALLELLATPADAAAGGEGRFVRSVIPRASVGIIVLVLSSPEGHEIGAGVDPLLWNGFFEQAEAKARSCDARLITTPLGHIMVHLTHPDGAEAAAQAAVTLALDLVDTTDESPRRRTVSPGRARVSFLSPRGSISRERALQVSCGVSVGTVHIGFAGSAQRRVEIADGPAVRRAVRMAAYSLCHGVGQVVTDAGCAAAAAALYTTWTTDLVSFDTRRDLREAISCVEPCEPPGQIGLAPGRIGAAAARCIQEAWDAVEAAADGGEAAVRRVQDLVGRLPLSATSHRAVRALHDAAAHPSTYCSDLEGAH